MKIAVSFSAASRKAVFALTVAAASACALAQTPLPYATGNVYVIGGNADDAGSFGFKRSVRGAAATGAGSTQFAPDYLWAYMTQNPEATACSYYSYNYSTKKFVVRPECTSYAVSNPVTSPAFANSGIPSISKQIEDLGKRGVTTNDIVLINQGPADFAMLFGLLGNLGEASKPIQTLIKNRTGFTYNGRNYTFTGCAMRDSNFINQGDLKTIAGALKAVNAQVDTVNKRIKGLVGSVMGQDYVAENMDGGEDIIAKDIQAIYMASIYGGRVNLQTTGESYWDNTPCGLLGWLRPNDRNAQTRILQIMNLAQIAGKQQVAQFSKDYMVKTAQILRQTVDQQLIAKGAKRIVIFNMPAVDLTPKFQAQFADILRTDGPEAVAENKKLVDDAIAAYNAEIARLFTGDPNVLLVDNYNGVKTLFSVYPTLGLKDVNNAFCPPLANGKWGTFNATPEQTIKDDKAVFDKCTLAAAQAYQASRNASQVATEYAWASDAYPTPILNQLNGEFLKISLSDAGWIAPLE